VSKLVLALLLAAACNGGGTDTATPNDAGAGLDVIEPPPNEGGLPPVMPELCKSVDAAGDQQQELALQSDPPPPLGGDIAPGIYDLTELDFYAGKPDASDEAGSPTPTSDRIAKATLTIVDDQTQHTLQLGESYGTVTGGLGAPTARAFVFQKKDTSLLASQACPDAKPTTAIPYSASGPGIALFIDANHRLVFARRP
jgi:hypothetical protein